MSGGLRSIGRIVATVVCCVFGVGFLLGLWLTAVPDDPHGYARIFGSLICLVCALVLLAAFPITLPPHAARIAGRISTAIFTVLTVGILAFIFYVRS